MRPMLAATLKKLSDLRYPVLATPKVDGIRCVILEGRAFSRSMKPIRNQHVQALAKSLPPGLDGELIAPGGTFQDTSSLIMSGDGGPDFAYLVFDVYNPLLAYKHRVNLLPSGLDSRVLPLSPVLVESESQFLHWEDTFLAADYEGVMTRDPEGPYLEKRSSPRDQALVKHKRFEESDAIVLHVLEQCVNLNPQVPDAFGYMKRPGGNAMRFPKGTLGSLVCKDMHTGVNVNVGSGFSAAQRDELWRDPPIGKVVRYRYQMCGTKDKPRFPRFVSFRDEEDM